MKPTIFTTPFFAASAEASLFPEPQPSPFHASNSAISIAAIAIVLLASARVAAPALAAPIPIGRMTMTLPSPLTLADAIRISLANQPQKAIATAQVEQEAGLKQEAQSKYFPTLNSAYNFANSKQTEYGFPTEAIALPNGGSYTVSQDQVIQTIGGSSSISLNETLFDNGARELSNAEARRNLAAAGFGSTNTQQEIVDTVTQDYYALLAAIDLVKVAQSDVDRYQQTLDLTSAQANAGTVARVQVYQATADLNNSQVTLLQDQASIQSAAATLKNAMGIETDAPIVPAQLSAANNLPALPQAGQQLTLQDYYAQAMASRPDLKQQQQAVDAQQLAVKQAEINAGITVGASYSLIYTPTNDNGAKGANSSLLVTASYPLFDAGNARGAVHVAQAQRDSALAQLESVRQQVRSDVEHAFVQRQANYQSATLSQAGVQAALENYNAAVASREAGVDTLLDVLTAQATLTNAQNQYVAAVYNFYISDANLQKAIGKNL